MYKLKDLEIAIEIAKATLKITTDAYISASLILELMVLVSNNLQILVVMNHCIQRAELEELWEQGINDE